MDLLLLLGRQGSWSELDELGALDRPLVVERGLLANFGESQLGIDWLVLNQIFGFVDLNDKLIFCLIWDLGVAIVSNVLELECLIQIIGPVGCYSLSKCYLR